MIGTSEQPDADGYVRDWVMLAPKGRVTLKQGVNVMVFKVTNEQKSWQGAMRLLDVRHALSEQLRGAGQEGDNGECRRGEAGVEFHAGR